MGHTMAHRIDYDPEQINVFGMRDTRTLLASLVDRVRTQHRRVRIQRNERTVAVLVSETDLLLLEALLTLAGIDPTFPATPKQPTGSQGITAGATTAPVSMPRHFGIYGSPRLYEWHAHNPQLALRKLCELVDFHAAYRMLPPECIGDEYWATSSG